MNIYGGVSSGLAVVRDATRYRVADNLQAVDQMQDNPQALDSRLVQNQAYLQLAADVTNLILRNITALEL